MARVAVVTDSTAYLPPGVADKHDVGVVPLHVVLGLRTGAEGVEVSPADVASALTERRVDVSTSRPTPAEFAEAYRACNAECVVSLHLSGALSGTVEAAHLAAAEVAGEGIEVRVVDTATIAMGLGFAVIAAAEAASAGGGVEAVVAAAEKTAAATTTLFYVDTLEHLRRGGRIGAAAALFGTALAVKPLLHVLDGRIAPLEQVRTASKALARLEAIAAGVAGEVPVDIAVHHLAAAEKAEALAERLRARVPGLQSMHVSEVGAVVGAHVGPGLLGVVVSRR
ncbi:MAG: fatty acid kinase fatty acid binding subunit [Actinomycetota bacterium]|jgi:DegV family protein with EDD domain|nr:fatty acid kinase fatty acid binding subunit [Actinomycetota bacterium]